MDAAYTGKPIGTDIEVVSRADVVGLADSFAIAR